MCFECWEHEPPRPVGWRPPTKPYVPGQPINPFHQPPGTPDEVLKRIWDDEEDEQAGDY